MVEDIKPPAFPSISQDSLACHSIVRSDCLALRRRSQHELHQGCVLGDVQLPISQCMVEHYFLDHEDDGLNIWYDTQDEAWHRSRTTQAEEEAVEAGPFARTATTCLRTAAASEDGASEGGWHDCSADDDGVFYECHDGTCTTVIPATNPGGSSSRCTLTQATPDHAQALDADSDLEAEIEEDSEDSWPWSQGLEEGCLPTDDELNDIDRRALQQWRDAFGLGTRDVATDNAPSVDAPAHGAGAHAVGHAASMGMAQLPHAKGGPACCHGAAAGRARQGTAAGRARQGHGHDFHAAPLAARTWRHPRRRRAKATEEKKEDSLEDPASHCTAQGPPRLHRTWQDHDYH